MTSRGWKGTKTSDSALLDPETGASSDFGFESDDETDIHKGSESAGVSEKMRLTLAACPTVAGRATGRYTHLHVFSTRGSGYSLVMTNELVTKITTHTKADGTLRDFDLDLTYQYISRAKRTDRAGHVIEADTPTFWSVHVVVRGLHTATASDDLFRKLSVPGVVSASGSSPNQDETAVFAVGMHLDVKRIAGSLDAEEHAWDTGACMHVGLDSTDLAFSPYLNITGVPRPGSRVTTMSAGQVGHLTATVTKRKGGTLAPGSYSIDLFRLDQGDAGHAAPSSGSFTSTPAGFTYTAPTQHWVAKAGTNVTLYFTVRSHQGRATAPVDISPTPRQYKLVYNHTSNGTFSFPYNAGPRRGSGTFSEQHDIALSATAPLTLNADATAGSGSGPLAWQRSTWATEDVNTSTDLANAQCTLDTKQQVVSTTPGTMTVKSLVLGPVRADGTPTIASLDVVLAGANDTWSTAEQVLNNSGCPAVPNPDYTYNRYLTDLWGTAAGWAGQGIQRIYISPTDSTVKGPGGVELKLDAPWHGATLASAIPSPDGYGDIAPPGASLTWLDSFQLVPVE